MFQLIRDHQLNIMFGLSSICVVVGFFALITKSLPKRRKRTIAYLEFSSSLLLYSDRLAYIYQGDASAKGYWMVRISNFLVFFMTISVVHAFNQYIDDICKNELNLKKIPVRIIIVESIAALGWILVIVSQFTGLYYYFDESNVYHRGNGFIICYIIPFAALFIQLSLIIQFIKKLSTHIYMPMLFFTVVPMLASIVQAFNYGVSLTNMAIVGMGIIIYVYAIIEMNDILEKTKQREIDEANRRSESIRTSFEQIVEALVDAADSRDRFIKGHSLRVADYSRRIAKELGMDDREAFRVYHSAALHDIGKVKLPDSVIQTSGRLTDSEEGILRTHPVKGDEILASVKELPYIGIAARYHHERYDGKGYPEGLKGEEIPLYARIVSVANAYDEMTSFRSDRQPLAQGKVRENLKKGSAKEFDPKIVDIMVGLIDRDTEYSMREADDEKIEESDRNDLNVVSKMHFDEYKKQVSDGIQVTGECLKITFETRPDEGFDRKNSIPAIILFDSFDRCVHRHERNIRKFRYFEFCEIWMDGHTISTAARDIKTDVVSKKSINEAKDNEWIAYELEAVSIKDHVKVKISSKYMQADVTVALPDATRFVYLGVSGEHCSIRKISVANISLTAEDKMIPRIVPEENNFTRKDGDIPNFEVYGYREKSSQGIPVADGMRLFFRSQSMPTASLVHHVAYIVLYSSDDGNVDGKNYQEYACIRLDGDDATNNGKAENKLSVRRNDDFGGWDQWKERNKNGLDYKVEFRRRKNRIIFRTGNSGIEIENRCIVPEGTDNVYVALTGNLCMLMDIRVR